MLFKVYLETTIISYLAARPSKDLITAAHQQLTLYAVETYTKTPDMTWETKVRLAIGSN